MPTSNEYLRNKFHMGEDGTNDIEEACIVIEKAGGTVNGHGLISVPDGCKDQDVWDAVTYLVHEYDYGMAEKSQD